MNKKVLVVEDDMDGADAMAALLEMEGYTACTARDGMEALEMLDAGLRPGLILLDLMMPVMDGWTFRQFQRDEPSLADIPVIIVSAVSDAMHYLASADAADHILKPVNADVLLAAVARHCLSPVETMAATREPVPA